MKRVYLKILPQPTIDFVFTFKIRLKVHQHGNWFARHRPTANAHLNALFLGLPLPLSEKRFILTKIRTFRFFPKVWTNEDDPVLQLILQRLGTRRKYSVDTAYLITDFPT